MKEHLIKDVQCETCGKVTIHRLVYGSYELVEEIKWNGIHCTSCGKITVAWAEDQGVREVHDRWLADGATNEKMEEIWTTMVKNLIEVTQLRADKQ